MDEHTLRFRGAGPPDGAFHYGPFLRHVLDALVDGCQQATRLRLEGRSTAPGAVPAWLEQAAAFHVLGFQPDALVLRAPPLARAIPDRTWRARALAEIDDPDRSGLDLLEDSLDHASLGREDSDRYDRHLMETFESFGRLFHYGVEAIELVNGRILRLDPEFVRVVRGLRARTPEDRQVSVSGSLEAIGHSDRRFAVVLDSGEVVRGVAASAELRAADLAALWGQPVIVTGLARFRPSGAILRIEAERIQAAGTDAGPDDANAEIRRLVEHGRVEEARERVTTEVVHGRAESVRAWTALLAPPTAARRPRSGRDDFELNQVWLREHQEEHRGEWVALRDGARVDSDPSLHALNERLRQRNLEHEVFLTRVEDRGATGT